MKPISLLFLAAVASASPSFSQDEKAATSSRTFVPDSLQAPVFTQPVPVEPKRLPNIRIDASTTVPTESGKTLTLQRGAASTLPDLPPPPPPEPSQSASKTTSEELAQQLYQLRHSISLGATVYDHKVSEVHWTDQETQTNYQAICGFDIGLIAGIGSFVRDGESYAVDMSPGDIDLQYASDSTLKIPAVSLGQILITQGDSKAPHATAALYFIKDLIDAEKERLTTFQEARKQQQREAAAWAAAHPPILRNETFILRPHRGSRYLANPQPEKTEGAR